MKNLVFLLIIIFCVCNNTYAQGAVFNDMVLIPGGEYLIDKNSNTSDHSPAHMVKIDSFLMDKYEVTNAQYNRFCNETGHRLPEFWRMDIYKSGLDFPNHPVIGVNWYDANKYASWAGKRLPTEAEWEIAVRGGLVNNEFPNGNELDTKIAYINAKRITRGPTEIGAFQANNFGLYDMAGNVWEWVEDRYSAIYYADSLFINPSGPENGRFRVFRGWWMAFGKIM